MLEPNSTLFHFYATCYNIFRNKMSILLVEIHPALQKIDVIIFHFLEHELYHHHRYIIFLISINYQIKKINFSNHFPPPVVSGFVRLLLFLITALLLTPPEVFNASNNFKFFCLLLFPILII